MEIAILGFTGHRDWRCSEQSLLRIEDRYPGATWIHGGADGFDSQVHEAALKLGKVLGETLLVIRPDYKQYSYNVAQLIALWKWLTLYVFMQRKGK